MSISIRYVNQRRWIFRFSCIASLAAVFVIAVNAGGINATSAKTQNQAELVLTRVGGDATISSARWCGPGSRIVWGGVNSGIHVYDVVTGREKIITEPYKYIEPFCSPDGNFVFMWDGYSRTRVAYDLRTGALNTIKCMDKSIFISPDMTHAVTMHSPCDSVRLPWREIKIDKVNASIPEYKPPSVWGWFPDNRRVILGFIKQPAIGHVPMGSTLAIYDVANAKLQKIVTEVSSPGSAERVKVTQDANYVYFIGSTREQQYPFRTLTPPSLYRVDLKVPLLKAQLIRKDVLDFDLHPLGKLMFIDLSEPGIGKLWSAHLDAGGAILLGDQLWSGVPRVSPDGTKMLLMKLDPYTGGEGPREPKRTTSVYLLHLP